MAKSRKEKFLIVRFSSIGDIVLTSPVLRSLRRCKPDAEIHFLTKGGFVPLLQHNPYLDKVIGFSGNLDETVKQLKAERYDFVLDLHQSLRSRLLRFKLQVPSAVYPKDRLQVTMYTQFRIGKLPERHTVDRYAVALKKLGCELDEEGIDFFIPNEAQSLALQLLKREFQKPPIAIALGGMTATKRWPKEYFIELINLLDRPVVLLGGKTEVEDAQEIASKSNPKVWVVAGEYDLILSGAILRNCHFAVTHDSGFMHIASAFPMKLFSIWGSTVPGFGFAPYKALSANILQVEGLKCRPCSKLGFNACPKGHFKCMRDLSPDFVFDRIHSSGVLEEVVAWKEIQEWL